MSDQILEIIEDDPSRCVPRAWRPPSCFETKCYIAILHGLDPRYRFDRQFLVKYRVEEPEGVYYDTSDFKDGMIIEMSSPMVGSNAFKVCLFQIEVLEDSIIGCRLQEHEARARFISIQSALKEELEGLFQRFGNRVVIKMIEQAKQARETSFEKSFASQSCLSFHA